ncbi:MAG: carboxypeptidase regulatory-like domain-containing protein [Bacteroidales bacterium]|nr:carboxypeptidase regulatory-like domain-containing protein [Bacteroidales bacterium]
MRTFTRILLFTTLLVATSQWTFSQKKKYPEDIKNGIYLEKLPIYENQNSNSGTQKGSEAIGVIEQVYPQSLDYWTGTTDGINKTEVSYIRSYGGGEDNGWMKFDISSIPGSVQVNSIRLYGYVTNTNYPYWSVTPMPIDPETSSGADIWTTAEAGSPDGIAYAYNNESSTYAPGWHDYLLENGAVDDLTNAITSGQGWFAVGIFERDLSNIYYLEFDGWNETNIPYLEIDYTILAFGVLNGTVTELATGDPVEGAEVHAVGPSFSYTVFTLADGSYEIDPCNIGTYQITCTLPGYNIATASDVLIEEGVTTTQNFQLTAPTMEISPSTLSLTLELNTQETEIVTIENNGNGLLNWIAELVEVTDGKDLTWVSIDPENGFIDPGNNTLMNVDFDTDGLIQGNVYYAEINFTSDPEVGTFTIPIQLTVGSLELGYIAGNVALDGELPYNIGNIEEVLVEAGPYFTHPNSAGDYQLAVYPGTYDVTASLYGYDEQTNTGIIVSESATTENVDFTLPCVTGKFYGIVTDLNSGAPIQNAVVSVLNTPFEAYTGSDGSYEIMIESGTYDLMASHPTYLAGLAQNQVVGAQQDTEVNFQLEYQCDFCSASGGCDEFIDGVELGDIVNLGTGCAGYQDFTDMSTLVIPDFSYTLTIHTGNVYSSDDYAVWIDWNRDCEFDPVSEQVVCVINNGQTTHNFEFTVPINATPGPAVMRVRLKFSGSDCGSPCGSTTYGEVEDYTVFIIPATKGNLEGYVTELSTGDPIEGAEIDVAGFFSTTTGSDGYYLIEEVYTGEWNVTCSHDAYNTANALVTILEDQTIQKDFELTAPTMEVSPLSFNVTLEYGQTQDETINISNSGNGPLNWSATYLVLGLKNDPKNYLDLQFQYPATGASSQIGIETDGNYFYTAKWSGSEFYKYEMDGTFVESFSIAGVGFIRDMAFDGYHFYGSNETNIVYEMDFENQTLVGTFVAPTDVRAIAYNDDQGVFYANKGSSDIYVFDKLGNVYGSFPVGSSGGSYYGLAYDKSSDGGPFLWGYSTNGTNSNTLVKIQLPDGNEVASLDLTTKLNGTVTDIAGGLFTHPNLIAGKWTLGGLVQDEWIWGLELGAYETWLNIEPGSGTLSPGDDIDMTLHLDATDIFPGTHEAEIYFTSDPNVASPVVDVTLFVPGLVPPVNLNFIIECMDILLTWQMPSGDPPDSWNIYRDDELITNVTEMEYTDPDLEPGIYVYYVTAVYDGVESIPSQDIQVNLQVPALLPMASFSGEKEGNDVHLFWNTSPTCLDALGYNVYRDGDKINDELITEMEYFDLDLPNGSYDYYGTAVFEYGESSATNTITIPILVGMEEIRSKTVNIFPNPAKEMVNIESVIGIKSVKIVDNKGNAVFENTTEGFNFQINVSQFESGIYIIQVVTDGEMVTRKIVIEQ